MAWNTEKAIEYAKEAKAAVFATVAEDGSPQVRYVGGYGIEGNVFYVNTGKDSAKVKQILAKPEVALIFQHEAQDSLKNVTFYGKASLVSDGDAEKAKEIIKIRRPQAAFDETKVIIRVDINRIKVLDFGEEVKNQEFKL